MKSIKDFKTGTHRGKEKAVLMTECGLEKKETYWGEMRGRMQKKINSNSGKKGGQEEGGES